MEFVGYDLEDLSLALNAFQKDLQEGQSIKVQLCTEELPSAEALNVFYLDAIAAGHHITMPVSSYDGGVAVTLFNITKGSPALALIVPVLVPLATIGLITFGIIKLENITSAIMPIILASGGIIILGIALLAPRAERVATKYLESRKMTYLPSVKYLPQSKEMAPREEKGMAKWVTARRQAYLVELWERFGGKCLQGHPNCPDISHYIVERTIETLVAIPVEVPCTTPEGAKIATVFDIKKVVLRYKVLLGGEVEEGMPSFGVGVYREKEREAIKEFVAEDREQALAEWQEEHRRRHETAERIYPLRGRFSGVSRDIFYADQPTFYIEHIGVSGPPDMGKVWAKVRIPSSKEYFEVDISDIISKVAKRKMMRYTRISEEARKRQHLPREGYMSGELHHRIFERCAAAVTQFMYG